MNMESEIWKDIKGYEGLYQVSNLGGVKSLDRITTHYKGGVSKLIGKDCSQCLSRGYLVVGLYLNGIHKTFRSHRLVAINFIENPKNKPEVNHINGIKTDNRASNLEWCTSSENSIHAHKTGLHKGSHLGLIGKLNPSSKAVKQFSLNGEFIEEYDSIRIASEATGIFPQNISCACNGKYKQAKGFIWKYSK